MEAAAALTDMYDQALLGILQHVGNVEEFLRVLFGFLYRKTDFYRLLLRPGDRLGFPPGAAQAMALQAFKVFERMARQDDEKRCRELEVKLRRKKEEEEEAAAERMKASPAAQEIEMESTAERVPVPDAEGAAGPRETAAAQDAAPAAPGSSSAEPPRAAAPAEPRPTELPTRQEQFQTNPDSYNGAVRENYAWSQDYSDLEIKVPVPKHIVKGKQVAVDISSGAIRVAVLEGGSQRVLMEGKLTHKINTESSLWSLEPGKCVLRLSASDEAFRIAEETCGGGGAQHPQQGVTSLPAAFGPMGFAISPGDPASSRPLGFWDPLAEKARQKCKALSEQAAGHAAGTQSSSQQKATSVSATLG
ncbi:nudC domain-containing protein 3 isoform X2 [Apteryx rowi]|uniref:nudC domain-containing protein 3 isoform X2 n=1 Tax=Apteryx rowi TaxID=308060 RepID=UPI000E1DA566|nr:nudC domain-containing protein 3 isoform X2 [Apteryx rowi]